MHVSSNYVPLDQCADIYSYDGSHVYVTEKVICIQNDNSTKQACYGKCSIWILALLSTGT